MKTYLKEKFENYKLRREGTDLKMAFYDSISMIPKKQWDDFSNQNIYLSYNYLSEIESAHCQSMDFRYILFYKEGKPVAKAMLQIIDFKFLANLKNSESKRKKFLSNLLKEDSSLRIMICGSAFSNGENGFDYNSKVLSIEDAYSGLATGIYRTRRSDKINGQTSVVLLKDFWPESKKEVTQFKKFDYRSFEIEPNMVIDINNCWTSIDDYLKSLTSKYRSKAKSVFKKSKLLKMKNLEIDDLKKHNERLAELFQNVYSKSDFKLIKFESESFIKLKVNLGEKLIVKGCFKEDLLVGFSFSILNQGFLDFNYVGIDYEHNRDLAIYQRMMYDQISIAIVNKCSKLQLGRTASEIKSSLGAIPLEMKILIRHRNSLSNKLIKPIVKSITAPDIIIRDPFKK
tara:strand:+ start:259 stop:1458 length:1200 start_codon:yes stop_codon:yes gene_type:complete